MNRQEHLLTILQEEAIEIAIELLDFAHAISKAKRFSLEDDFLGPDRNNLKDMGKEFSEMLGLVYLLDKEHVKIPGIQITDNGGSISFTVPKSVIDHKLNRVEEFFKYSKKNGCLN
jgi:hypothetical protein